MIDSLLPSGSETQLLADQIEEAHNLLGTPARLFLPKEYSVYLDNIQQEDKSTRIRILIQNNPQKRLLLNLGWWQENPDANPVIAYVPYTMNGRNLVVTEHSTILMDDRTMFDVQAINRNYLYGLWQILQLTPQEGDNRAKALRTSSSKKTALLRTNHEEVEV